MRKASELTFAIKRRLVADESAVALRSFETFFYDWLERTEPQLLKAIRDTRTLSDDLREALTRAVQAAKSAFAKNSGADEPDDAHAEDGGEG